MENYYEILQVKNFAEIEVIKASYRALSKKYHPDVNKNVDEKIMIKINLAYEVLNDTMKKKEYDKELKKYLNDNHKSTCTSNEANINQNNKVETNNKGSKIISFMSDLFGAMASSYMKNAQEIQKVIENAYYSGSTMSDEELIRNFLKSSGYKRKGYSKVLLERSLLYKEGDKLVPSYTFSRIAKYYRN